MKCRQVWPIVERFDTASVTELNAMYDHLAGCLKCTQRLLRMAAAELAAGADPVRCAIEGAARGQECLDQKRADPECPR